MCIQQGAAIIADIRKTVPGVRKWCWQAGEMAKIMRQLNRYSRRRAQLSLGRDPISPHQFGSENIASTRRV